MVNAWLSFQEFAQTDAPDLNIKQGYENVKLACSRQLCVIAEPARTQSCIHAGTAAAEEVLEADQ